MNSKSQQGESDSHRITDVNYDFAQFTASQVTPREHKVEMVQYAHPERQLYVVDARARRRTICEFYQVKQVINALIDDGSRNATFNTSEHICPSTPLEQA